MTAQRNESEIQLAALAQTLAREANEKAALEKSLADQTKTLEGKIQELTQKQGQSQDELAALEDQLNQQAAEKAALKNASAAELAELEEKYKDLQGDYDKKRGELESLEDDIEKGREQIAGLEKEHQGQVKELEDKFKGLQDAYEANQAEVARLQEDLGSAREDLEDTAENLSKAESDLTETSKELQKALELARNRQDVAQRIKDDFAKAGIIADVDKSTGDVILDFGNDYFETDSYKLKPGMRATIRRAIPVYAKSLFDRESATADISSIEIIGFASPTYGGKPVNPNSLSLKNRKAVNYNLDLSYARARSIFEFVFDTQKLKFKHQDAMLPLIKVTGRSFFTEQVDPNDTGNLSRREFCKLYNCLESQRVIIKFGLIEKRKA